jgi:hypothetical protein
MTKPKLSIKLDVEQLIAGENDDNRLSCVRPELGEIVILIIKLKKIFLQNLFFYLVPGLRMNFLMIVTMN